MGTAEGIPVAKLEESDNSERKDEIEKMNTITNTANEDVSGNSEIEDAATDVLDDVDAIKKSLITADEEASTYLKLITTNADDILSRSSKLLEDCTSIASTSMEVKKLLNAKKGSNEAAVVNEQIPPKLDQIISIANAAMQSMSKVQSSAREISKTATEDMAIAYYDTVRDTVTDIGNKASSIVDLNSRLLEDAANIASIATKVKQELSGTAGDSNAVSAKLDSSQADSPASPVSPVDGDTNMNASAGGNAPISASKTLPSDGKGQKEVSGPTGKGQIQQMSLRPSIDPQ